MLVLLPAIAAAGCALVHDPSRHQTSDPVEAERFCPEFARVLCRGHEECCVGAAPPECLVLARDVCNEFYGSFIDDPRTGYDAEEAGRIVARADHQIDTCDLGFLEFRNAHAFRRLFAGTLAEGETCTPADMTDYSVLAACAGTDMACQPADPAFRTYTCQPVGGVGHGCLIGTECVPELYCARPDEETPGTCQPRLDNGAPCSRPDECASGVCLDGLCSRATAVTVYCLGTGE